MQWPKMNMSKRIAVAIVGIFVVSTLLLCFVQQYLFSQSFEKVLVDVEQSTLDLKRESARDLLREVRIAVEGSLQRGEYVAFTRFSQRQAELEEVRAFSFLDENRQIKLSSDEGQIGQTIDTALWEKIEQADDALLVEDDELLSYYEPLRIDPDMRRLRPHARVGELYGVLHLEFAKDRINHMLNDARASARASDRRTLGVMLVVMTVVAVLVCVAAGFLARRLVRPLLAGVQFARSVAAGNLTERLEIRQNDEVGELAKALNGMADDLQEMVRGLSENASTLSGSAGNLTATAAKLAGGAEETTRQSSTAATAAEEMSDNINKMAAASDRVTDNVKTAAVATEQMTASIGEIAKNAEQASQVAGNAASLAESSNATIGRLGDAADEIGKVIEVIQDIAEQTNLLDLNATIEAARAGEAGKGFAVVATEVKELAKQTAEATEDIRRRIGAIQNSSNDAVQSIGQIGDVIQQVNEISSTIASAVEKQSVTTREIAQNINQTSTAAETVSAGVTESASASKEISQSIGGVDESAQQTSQGAAQTQVAGTKMTRLAEELQSLVGQFQV